MSTVSDDKGNNKISSNSNYKSEITKSTSDVIKS